MIRSFGDSLTFGYGVLAARRFTNVMQSSLGVTIENNGVSAATACSHSAVIYGKTIAAGDKSTYFIGNNDHISYKTSAPKRDAFKKILEAQIAWLCIPTKTNAKSAVVTKSAGWANTVAYGLGIDTVTNGATASFVFDGNVCFIGMIQRDSPHGASSYSVTVDGVLYGNYSSLSPGIASNGVDYAPYLVVIDLPTSGLHEIVITKISGTGHVLFDWYATPSMDASLIQIGLPQFSHSAYSAQGTSADNVLDYNDAIEETVIKMSQWLDVQFLPTIELIESLDIVGDGVHWNSNGHLKLANQLIPKFE